MPILEIRKGNNLIQQSLIEESLISIGRELDNHVFLEEKNISRYHAKILQDTEGYFLIDLGSANGTYLNGAEISPKRPRLLVNGDIIRIGSYELRFSTEVSPAKPLNVPVSHAPTIVGSFHPHRTKPPENINMRDRQVLRIGRDDRNDTVINHPAVSRFHAKIQRKNGSFYITDSSTNGTFINGKRVTREQLLKVNDQIRIGSTCLIFNVDETFIHQNDQENLRIDALKLNKVVGNGVNLLHDISLSILPKEFVVVAGVSGGGKSTLLNALNGFRPATSGEVLVNGVDLYQNFNAYHTEIGYVPQQDIIHRSLTVGQTLEYAAKLRMPTDATTADRKNRIDSVLADLELTERKNVPVEKLSGGQLKRISMGVELLTEPSLFFLDEATSGLDPGTEGEIMRLLRKLADQGRTVILITHATENVMQCDLVAFLAKGGYLAYFGPPQEAAGYFQVNNFNEIYRKVENQDIRSPQQWQDDYFQSPYYNKYVVERQQNLTPNKVAQKRQFSPLPGGKVQKTAIWQQFCILSSRNLAILLQDKISLWLMLAIAPLLGLLDFVLWPRHIFDVGSGKHVVKPKIY